MNNVLELKNIDLIYRSSESLSFKNLLGIGTRSVINSYKALNDVSLIIEKGKVYGIVGSNGAGKSTLLRVLSGAMSPNSGSINRNHHTINLLALGIGFSKELKGIDNIYLNGMLLGFPKKEIKAVLSKIIEYSELGDFIYRPLKTYSTGMVSRLGFSIAIHLRPDILLIDEVLSVGDAKFRKKSYESLLEIIKDKDTTVVIVSHGDGELKKICDSVIWLDRGHVIKQGNADEVLDLYAQFNRGEITIEQVNPSCDSISVCEDGSFDVQAQQYMVHMLNAEVKQFLHKETDFIKYYRSSHGTLKVTKRVLHTEDTFIFFEYQGEKTKIKINVDTVRECLNYMNLYKKPPFDNRYGENKATGLNAYLDMDKGSAVVSNVYSYNILQKKYEDNTVSTVYELVEEDTNVEIKKKGEMILSVGSKVGASSFFILLSKNKLFANRDNLNNYMGYFYEAVYNNSVWNTFFVVPAGTYTKLPYSIEPFTKEGYGYSLHHSSRKDMIPFFEETKERFFENFIANAVIQSFLYQEQEHGMFLSNYTSTWLKKDTGITAPYVDTRLNETFTLMVQDFQKLTSHFDTLDPMLGYVEFFCKQYELGVQVYTMDGDKGKGVFFPDYFKSGLGTLTHTSLNHQLGIAQMFLRAWGKYKNEDYKTVLEAMLIFIDYTHEKWIQKNDDLFYGIKQDSGGQFEYFDKDYVYVTLLDLLLIQKALQEHGFNKYNAIDVLIQSKLKFLRTTEYDIFNPHAKKASGERMDSAELALKLYKKLYE